MCRVRLQVFLKAGCSTLSNYTQTAEIWFEYMNHATFESLFFDRIITGLLLLWYYSYHGPCLAYIELSCSSHLYSLKQLPVVYITASLAYLKKNSQFFIMSWSNFSLSQSECLGWWWRSFSLSFCSCYVTECPWRSSSSSPHVVNMKQAAR